MNMTHDNNYTRLARIPILWVTDDLSLFILSLSLSLSFSLKVLRVDGVGTAMDEEKWKTVR